MKRTPIKLSLLDKAVGYFNPEALVKRTKAKMAMANAGQMGYVVAGSPKKTMKGFIASPNSPAADTVSKLSGARASARDMFMNTPLAVAAISRTGANVVGSGLMPQISPDYEALGITPEEAKAWAKDVERRFDTWARSKNSDFMGLFDFYDNQMLAFLSVILNGDAFFMLPWRKDPKAKKWPWELKLQLIEADLVRNPEDRPYSDKKDIVSGVEFEGGRVSAYHFANFYPSQIPLLEARNLKKTWKRVELYDSEGRQNVYHLLPPSARIGQRRGMSMLAPIIDMLKTTGRHSEAYLTSQLVESLFTVFIKDMSGMGGYLNEGFTPTETVGGGGTTVDADGNQVRHAKDEGSELDLELGHGNVHYLDENKEIQFADPKRNPEGFDPFFKAMVRQLSAAIEIPAEQLLLEFNTSYSSARAALLEAWKMYKRRRLWLARNFCQPILEAFIEELVAKGEIKAKGFLEDIMARSAWANALWIGPGNGQIDPNKEANAAVTKIQNNLSTHEEEYMADKGGRWDSAMNRKEQELALLQEKGLALAPREQAPEELTGPTGTNPQK